VNVEQIYKSAIRKPVMGRKGLLLTGVFLAPLMAAAASNVVHADDLRLTPSIEFGETYTDNVLLTSTNRQYDWVQSISPRLQVTDSSAKVDLNVTGGADYLYFDRLNKDDLRPYLLGTATIEVVPDFMKIVGQASIQESLIDPAGAISLSPFNDTSNRQTLQLYSTGATFFHHFGSIADAQVDYLFSYTNTNANQTIGGVPQNLLNSVYLHNVRMNVDSGEAFTKFTWNAEAAYIHSHTTPGPQATPGTLPINVGQYNVLFTGNYILNSHLALIADVGYDHLGNNTAAAAAVGNFLRGGVVYHGGFELKSPKSRIRILVGHRFGALNVSASAEYDYSARTTMTATYTEEVTTSAQRLAQLLGLAAQSDFNTIFNVDPRFTLSDEQFLTRRGNLTFAATRGKNSFTLDGYAERRSYRIVPIHDWVYGGTLDYSRQLNRKWTFDSRLLYTYQNFNNFVNRQDDIYGAQIGLTDQFARSIKASLTYRLTYRSSTDPNFDVQENAVTLLLTTVF